MSYGDGVVPTGGGIAPTYPNGSRHPGGGVGDGARTNGGGGVQAPRTPTEEGEAAAVDDELDRGAAADARGDHARADKHYGKAMRMAMLMSDASVDLMVRRALQGRHESASRALAMISKQMEALTALQNEYSQKSEELEGAAAGADKGGDEVELPENFDPVASRDFLRSQAPEGQEADVPEWLDKMANEEEQRRKDNPGVPRDTKKHPYKAKKDEVMDLSKRYSTAATSVGSDIRQLETTMQTASDQRKEAIDAWSAWQSGNHELAIKIISRI